MSFPALALPGPVASRPALALSRRQRRGLALLLMLALHLAVLLPLSRLRLTSEAPAPVMVGVWVPTPPAPAVPLPAAAPPRAPAPPLPTQAAPVLSTRTPVPAAQPTLAAAPEAAPEAAAEAAPSVATPPGPVAESLSPPSYQAAYLNNPQPAYPLLSRKQREEGTVRLRVLVSAAGRAEQVRVHAGSGYERLDRAALAAVQEWRFVPARRGEQNVSGWVEVPIQFKLEN